MWWNFLLSIWVAAAVSISAQEPEPEVDCSLVSYAFFPLEDDCSKFLFCNDGQKEEFSCRDGEIWSQVAGACVLGDSNTCQEWSPELACGGNNTKAVLPYPNNCSKFIVCKEDKEATIEDCGDGLIFLNDRCVVGSWDECESYEPMCDSVENDKLEHPDRCDAFIKCGAENVTLEFCPEDEIFLIELSQCVLGDLKTCEPLPISEICKNRTNQTLAHPDRCHSYVECNEKEEPSEKDCPRGMIWNSRDMKCVIGNMDTCELLDLVCMNVTAGKMLEHPNHCDIYIDCLEEEDPQLGYCSSGRIWRQDMMFCVPGDQTNCVRAPIESMCDNLPFGLVFPHPEDCSILVQCSITEAVEIPCPPHNILQPGTLDCVLGDQNNCTSFNELCVDKMFEIIALPNTCDGYVFCRNEMPELHKCPPGDIFNAILGRCSPGDMNTCEFFECSDPNTVSRHPNFCNLFTRCFNGQISTQFCPVEHIFHENMKRCTPGNVTSCQYDALEKMCASRFNNTVYPYPTTDTQCTDYVLCMDGEAKVQTCPEGMVLRPEHLDCIPGVKQTCEALDIVCLADEQSVMVHPDNCDMKIVCNNGTFAVEVCPSGQIVDPNSLTCVMGICETPINECIGKPDGVYEHSDCSRYVVCTDEVMSILNCPEREIFLANQGICFPGSKTDCQPLTLQFMCEGRQSGTVYPDLDNCLQFVTCSNDQATQSTCARGNVFSTSHRQCLAGASCSVIEGCENAEDSIVFPHPDGCDLFVECKERLPHAKECPLDHIITSDSNSECVPGDLSTCNSICYGQPVGKVLPHPRNCTHYYECMDDETINLETCPPGTIFNQLEGLHCIPGDNETCLPVENRCTGRPDGRYELDPSDCSRYMMCRDEIMTVENCPEREIFLSNIGICFPGAVIGCAIYPLETMCQNREDASVYPDPEDCSHFITCNNNEATRTPCTRGNIYHSNHRQCLAGLDCEHFDLCSAQVDGTVLLYPGEDCELFIRCESQLSRAEECVAGEIITSETDGCVPGNSATCTTIPDDNRFMRQLKKIRRISKFNEK